MRSVVASLAVVAREIPFKTCIKNIEKHQFTLQKCVFMHWKCTGRAKERAL